MDEHEELARLRKDISLMSDLVLTLANLLEDNLHYRLYKLGKDWDELKFMAHIYDHYDDEPNQR